MNLAGPLINEPSKSDHACHGTASGEHIVRACAVCSGTAVTPLPQYTTSAWPVVSCRSCGFVFLHEVPGEAALVDNFAWEKTFVAERERREKRAWSGLERKTRWRLKFGKLQDRFHRSLTIGKSGNVLDIGCGGSCRLPDGVTPFGIEVSQALARKADEKFRARGGYVVCAPARAALDSFADGFFTAMVMRSYLEHEENPVPVLETAYRKLVPGGAIYVRVPNYGSLNRRIMGANWCGFRFPDHVNYFTEQSLRALAAKSGFTYRRCNKASLFDDNLLVVLARPVQT